MRRPEEWLASTVTRWGTTDSGLTELGDLGSLADLVADDPEGWLGDDHVARWGTSPAAARQVDRRGGTPARARPPHPQLRVDHLGCPFGKTEAWVVLDVPAGGGTVFVGTTRPVRRDEWAELVDAQAADAMLDLLHPATVNAGDGVVVPASTPHCFDAGVFIVELQEPTDFSVLLEWEGFDVDGPADGHLGLGFDVALDAVRTDAFTASAVDALIRRADSGSVLGRAASTVAGPSPIPTSEPGASTTPSDPSRFRRRSPWSSSPAVWAPWSGQAAPRRSHAATRWWCPTRPAR